MATQNLAEVLAADLAGLGLAELVAPGVLKAADGNSLALVELQQDGDTISIYESGDSIAELDTTDADFNERFLSTLATVLNF